METLVRHIKECSKLNTHSVLTEVHTIGRPRQRQTGKNRTLQCDTINVYQRQ